MLRSEIPSSLGDDDRLVWLTGRVSRGQAFLLVAMQNLAVALETSLTGYGWPHELFDLSFKDLHDAIASRARVVLSGADLSAVLSGLAKVETAWWDAEELTRRHWLASPDGTWSTATGGLDSPVLLGADETGEDRFLSSLSKLERGVVCLMWAGYIVRGEERSPFPRPRHEIVQLASGDFDLREDGSFHLPGDGT